MRIVLLVDTNPPITAFVDGTPAELTDLAIAWMTMEKVFGQKAEEETQFPFACECEGNCGRIFHVSHEDYQRSLQLRGIKTFANSCPELPAAKRRGPVCGGFGMPYTQVMMVDVRNLTMFCDCITECGFEITITEADYDSWMADPNLYFYHPNCGELEYALENGWLVAERLGYFLISGADDEAYDDLELFINDCLCGCGECDRHITIDADDFEALGDGEAEAIALGCPFLGDRLREDCTTLHREDYILIFLKAEEIKGDPRVEDALVLGTISPQPEPDSNWPAEHVVVNLKRECDCDACYGDVDLILGDAQAVDYHGAKAYALDCPSLATTLAKGGRCIERQDEGYILILREADPAHPKVTSDPDWPADTFKTDPIL